MLTKTIIAGAAAALIGAGALAATTATASATYYGNGYVTGNGWYLGWGHTPRYRPPPPPVYGHPRPRYLPARRQVCTPKFEIVRTWKPYHGWVSRRVYAGQVCRWQPLYRKW